MPSVGSWPSLVEKRDDGACLTIPGVARYLVAAGGQVEVERQPGATDFDIACFARGPVAALSELLAGRFPLRAAAVTNGEQAVVLCGRSAAGKSAVAAALLVRSPTYSLVSDKVLTIDPIELRLRGTQDGVELWPPVTAALGLDQDTGSTVRTGLAKRLFFSRPTEIACQPKATVAIFLDIDNRLEEPQCLLVPTGRERLQALIGAQWHRRLVAPLGLARSHLEWSSDVSNLLPVRRIHRPRHQMTLDKMADLVEDELESLAHPVAPAP